MHNSYRYYQLAVIINIHFVFALLLQQLLVKLCFLLLHIVAWFGSLRISSTDLNQHVQQALADNTTLCVEAVGGQAMHGMLQPRLAAQNLPFERGLAPSSRDLSDLP
ncbi:MAG: hypothetical protein FRX49_04002 [Trebouxia sp. A1-2]|nr:MAG: hypothetical protein FRX49_04002 [Trebouxia sp. A1-2]